MCFARCPQDIHYTVDEKQRNVLLTEDGYEAVEDVLQVRGCAHADGGGSSGWEGKLQDVDQSKR